MYQRRSWHVAQLAALPGLGLRLGLVRVAGVRVRVRVGRVTLPWAHPLHAVPRVTSAPHGVSACGAL